MSNYKQDRFAGDVTVRNNVTTGGNADISGSVHVDGDLRVGGRLIGGFVNSANMGLYESEEALKAAFPSPKVGMYAQVIVADAAATAVSPTAISAIVYICTTAGTWTKTARTTTLAEIATDEFEAWYAANFKTDLDSAVEDLTTKMEAADTKLDNEKADIVDLAEVVKCACADAENVEPCGCCVLPTLKAVFIYTMTDGTIVVPHMRSIHVKNQEGYDDGYYIAFGITHTAGSVTDHDERYMLFNLADLKLVGQYRDNSKIKAPEWIRYAFSEKEVSAEHSGLMTPNLYTGLCDLLKAGVNGTQGIFKSLEKIGSYGKLTDYLDRVWKISEWADQAETPTITIEDVTQTVAADTLAAAGSKAIFRITLACATEDATIYYKIDKADGTSVVDATEYDQPVNFYARTNEETTYKITAWAQVGDDTNTKSEENTDSTSMVDAKRLMTSKEYGAITVNLSYATLPNTAQPNVAPTTSNYSQAVTVKYTWGTDNKPFSTTAGESGTPVTTNGTVVFSGASAVEGATVNAGTGAITCGANTSTVARNVIDVTMTVTANEKKGTKTVTVTQAKAVLPCQYAFIYPSIFDTIGKSPTSITKDDLTSNGVTFYDVNTTSAAGVESTASYTVIYNPGQKTVAVKSSLNATCPETTEWANTSEHISYYETTSGTVKISAS